MNREFSINVVILLLINFLVKPAYIFFVEAGVQNLVGKATYGQYFILLDFVFLFIFLNDLGLQNYNSKHLAQNRQHAMDYFGEMLGLKILASVLFFVVVVASGYVFGYLQESKELLMLIAGVFIVNSSFVLLRSSLSAMGKYRWDSWISALDKILLLVGLGYLVFKGYRGHEFDIHWLPIGQLCAGLTSVSIALLLVVKSGIKFRLKFDWNRLWAIAKSAWPYMLILLLSSAYNRVDAVMLDKLLIEGKVQSGIYAAAYRFVEAGNMVGFLFASLLLPMYANMWSEKVDFTPLFKLSFKFLFLLGILGAGFSFFYAEELYALVYVADYREHIDILKVLMLSFLPVCLSHVFGSMLIATDNVKVVNIIFCIGLVLNVICNTLFIPEYKALGASWATVITQYFLLLSLMIYVLKSRLVVNSIRVIVSSIGIAILFVGILIMLVSLDINLWLSIPIVIFTLFIHIYFSGWLKWSDIMGLK